MNQFEIRDKTKLLGIHFIQEEKEIPIDIQEKVINTILKVPLIILSTTRKYLKQKTNKNYLMDIETSNFDEFTILYELGHIVDTNLNYRIYSDDSLKRANMVEEKLSQGIKFGKLFNNAVQERGLDPELTRWTNPYLENEFYRDHLSKAKEELWADSFACTFLERDLPKVVKTYFLKLETNNW